MARIVCVASGKGGVGKTTSVVNLGKALKDFGYNTIIIDGNINTPNLSIHLGLSDANANLKQVLFNKKNIFESVHLHSNGTKVVPAGINMWSLNKISKNKLKVVQKLKEHCDIILLDCPPGISDEAEACIKASDEVLVVTNPNLPSVTDALKTIVIAKKHNKHVSGTIINRREGKDYEMSEGNIKEFLGVPVITVVPEDEKVKRALSKQRTVIDLFPKCKASNSFKKAAATLMGKDYKPGFWGRVKRLERFLNRV